MVVLGKKRPQPENKRRGDEGMGVWCDWTHWTLARVEASSGLPRGTAAGTLRRCQNYFHAVPIFLALGFHHGMYASTTCHLPDQHVLVV